MNKKLKGAIEEVAKPYRKMGDTVPMSAKCLFALLAVASCADLFFTQSAMGKLLDADSGGLSSWVIAVSITGVIIALNNLAGKSLKGYVSKKESRDTAKLAVSVICPLASLALIAGITAVRYVVGAGSGGALEAYLAANGGQVAAQDMGKVVAEVAILCVALAATSILSFVLAYVTCDPDEVGKRCANASLEEHLAVLAKRCACDPGFTAELKKHYEEIVEANCDLARAQFETEVWEVLLGLCTDPALATEVYNSLLKEGGKHVEPIIWDASLPAGPESINVNREAA